MFLGPTWISGKVFSASETERKPATTPPVNRFRRPSPPPGLGTPFQYAGTYRGNLRELLLCRQVRSGILVDLTTRKVLWAKAEQQPVPIASMTKMMTLLLALENLEKKPEWTLDHPVRISRTAAAAATTGIIWLDARETLPLQDLLKAVAIKSANDAAWQVAEFFTAGKVENFLAAMNQRAAQLNLSHTRFVSPNGLPDRARRNCMGSAEDMARLGEQLLEYPLLMTWFSTRQTMIERPQFHKKTELTNTNRLLLQRCPGVDGLKTGFTQAAGFCMTFTASRNQRRLLGCVTGLTSASDRDRFIRQLLEWGFQQTDGTPRQQVRSIKNRKKVSSSVR